MANDPLFPRATGPAIYSGTVARDVTGNEDAYAKIDGADPDLEAGPCMWMPRGTARPSAGDRCSVVENHTGGWTMLAWRPA